MGKKNLCKHFCKSFSQFCLLIIYQSLVEDLFLLSNMFTFATCFRFVFDITSCIICRWRYYLEYILVKNVQIILKKCWSKCLFLSFILLPDERCLLIVHNSLMLTSLSCCVLYTSFSLRNYSAIYSCSVLISIIKGAWDYDMLFCFMPSLILFSDYLKWCPLIVFRANPVQAGSQAELSQWLCHVHNVVNRR